MFPVSVTERSDPRVAGLESMTVQACPSGPDATTAAHCEGKNPHFQQKHSSRRVPEGYPPSGVSNVKGTPTDQDTPTSWNPRDTRVSKLSLKSKAPVWWISKNQNHQNSYKIQR